MRSEAYACDFATVTQKQDGEGEGHSTETAFHDSSLRPGCAPTGPCKTEHTGGHVKAVNRETLGAAVLSGHARRHMPKKILEQKTKAGLTHQPAGDR